jgi:hypothetical protein
MGAPFIRRAACAAVVVTLASSCGGRREGDAPAASARPWSVNVGSQGGFTGGGSGHWVRSDGTVASWSRITPQDSITTRTAGVASGETLRALHATLESLDASQTVFASTGNMTVFIEWMEAPAPRRWSWPAGTPDAKIPSPVHRAYLAALAAVAGARPAP